MTKNVAKEQENLGGCANCGVNETCVQGQCCPQGCTPGLCCQGDCCRINETCQDGKCVCPVSCGTICCQMNETCQDEQCVCPVVCVSTCCQATEICQDGKCVCPEPQVMCGTACCGIDETCQDGKCGCPATQKCGIKCCSASQTCSQGQCCPQGCSGDQCCNGLCCGANKTCQDGKCLCLEPSTIIWGKVSEIQMINDNPQLKVWIKIALKLNVGSAQITVTNSDNTISFTINGNNSGVNDSFNIKQIQLDINGQKINPSNVNAQYKNSTLYIMNIPIEYNTLYYKAFVNTTSWTVDYNEQNFVIGGIWTKC